MSGSLSKPISPGFVYIAGPYRAEGKHDYTVYEGIDANISRARSWAAKLATEGIPFFCPHLNSAHFEVIAPYIHEGFWLEMDLVIMSKAWAILLMPEWETSSGAQFERQRAYEWGLGVYRADEFDALVSDWRFAKMQLQVEEEE